MGFDLGAFLGSRCVCSGSPGLLPVGTNGAVGCVVVQLGVYLAGVGDRQERVVWERRVLGRCWVVLEWIVLE